MGTNFYLRRREECPCCKRPLKSDLHIGKSSCGWQFGFHGYREESDEVQLASCKDWFAFLATELVNENNEIMDEYDRPCTLEEFKAMVIQLQPAPCRRSKSSSRNEWVDAEGYDFSGYDFS
jgi:hypothetical protein